MDRSEAYNLLFGTDGTTTVALAQWVFVSPEHIQQFGNFLSDHRDDTDLVQWHSSNQPPIALANPFHGPPVDKSPTRPLLTDRGVQELQAKLGEQNVRVVLQQHGDLVHVPPGWMHQVKNLGPCVKLAYDLLKPESAGAYLEVYNLVHQHGLFAHFHTDYVGLQPFLKKRLMELAQKIKPSD